jgi:hypothetical protein
MWGRSKVPVVKGWRANALRCGSNPRSPLVVNYMFSFFVIMRLYKVVDSSKFREI